MIHETMESGVGITQDKGNYQELIVALMSLECLLGNVIIFHMYLVVTRTKIKFNKIVSTT
jgi:hypothetical protein